MKIVVFGASRGVGLKDVEQALQAGHMVTAFVRTPSKMEIKHANLTLFQGDSMDAAAVEKAVAGQEAVVSALGPTRPPVAGMMKTSARNIVAAMKKHGVRRIVSTTGAGVRQPEDQPKLMDHFIGFLLNLLAKNVVLDSAANVKVIQAADVDWAYCRACRPGCCGHRRVAAHDGPVAHGQPADWHAAASRCCRDGAGRVGLCGGACRT